MNSKLSTFLNFAAILFAGLNVNTSLAQVDAPVLQKPKCTTHYWVNPLPTSSNDYDNLYYETEQKAIDILIRKGYKEPYEEVSCSSPVRVGRMVRRYPDGSFRCFYPVPSYLTVGVHTKYKKRGRYSDFNKPIGFKASADHRYHPENDPKWFRITGYYLEKEVALKPGLNRIQYQQQFLEFVESLPKCGDLKLIRAVGQKR